MAVEYVKKLCMRRYHVYENLLETGAGEMLVCSREPPNSHTGKISRGRRKLAITKNTDSRI